MNNIIEINNYEICKIFFIEESSYYFVVGIDIGWWVVFLY